MARRKKSTESADQPTFEESAGGTESAPAEEMVDEAASESHASEPEDFQDLIETTDLPMPVTSGRTQLSVTAVVHFRESKDESWRETTHIKTISKNGAGLVVSREVPVGRIVSLVLGMPRDLRLYDLHAPGYPMLAVVQNCVSMEVDGEPFYHVGVAFVGKEVPAALKKNPKQCYRITGLNGQGLWEVVESANPFQPRKHLRFWSRFQVTVAIRDAKTRTSRKRHVFTRDVSGGGMSVFGPLDARIGDRVKVMSRDYDYYSMATVRNRTDNDEDEKLSLVHFEFDEADFPVERLATPTEHRQDEFLSDVRDSQPPWEDPEDGEVTRF